MKPTAQVEKGMRWDHEQRKMVDLHSVALLPTHEDGHFLIDDSYYGKQVVGKVVLRNVSQEDLESMHTTGEFPLDSYVATDESGKSTPIVGKADVNVPFNRGSGNSVTMSVDSFREFAPVTAESAVVA